MRTIAPLVGLLLLLGPGTAFAQRDTITIPKHSHTIWKSYSDGGVWKWGFHTDAQQHELPGLQHDLERQGYKPATCGNNPPEYLAYAVCAYNICPNNGCPYDSTTRCPTPRPVVNYTVQPNFYYQPCPLTPCVQVCQPVQCERPRLFPVLRRCR